MGDEGDGRGGEIKKCRHSKDGKGSKEDGKEWEEEGDGKGWWGRERK